MKMILGGRRTGKTYKLIHESAKTGAVIVTHSQTNAETILQQAISMRLSIPHPISYKDLKYSAMIPSRPVLIDDLELFLDYLPYSLKIKGFSLGLRFPKDELIILNSPES